MYLIPKSLEKTYGDVSSARYRYDVCALGEQPCKGNLSRRGIVLVRDRLYCFDDFENLREVLFREPVESDKWHEYDVHTRTLFDAINVPR